jgi:cyclophilin family peptidyl-prolyl cis-trans isomerase
VVINWNIFQGGEMKRKLIFTFALLAGVTLLAGCGTNTNEPPSSPGTPTLRQTQWDSPPAMTIDQNKTYTAIIKTNYGDITVQLLPEESPIAVNNFVFLARQGFYEGVKFHRIMKTFMIQTGDPTGTGGGGPGYRFADELPPKHSYEPGIVAMANAGANTNGSQFFICTGEDSRNLNMYPNYTQFGRVTGGMDVVQKIASVPVRPDARGELSQPTVDVHIVGVTIEEE